MTTEGNENLPKLRFKLDLEGVSTAPLTHGQGLHDKMKSAERMADSVVINGVPRKMDPASIKALLDCIPGVYEVIESWLMRQQDGLKDISGALASRGWAPFQKLTYRQLHNLGLAVNQQPMIVDEIMTTYVRDRISEIENELITRHDSRGQLIVEAFQAHRMGWYGLSIPAFMIQSDGICYDLLGSNLFVSHGRRDILSAFDADPLTSSITLIQHLLDDPIPLWMTARQRAQDFDELNRHLVLHGISTTYNTEVFSLKAMAFLSWLSFSLDQLDKDHNDQSG